MHSYPIPEDKDDQKTLAFSDQVLQIYMYSEEEMGRKDLYVFSCRFEHPVPCVPANGPPPFDDSVHLHDK